MTTKIHNEFSFDKEIYIDRFIAKNATRFPDFMNSLDKLKQKKQHLEAALSKYQLEGKDMLDYLKITRKFVETQTKVDEERKETEVPDEDDIELCDPDDIGKIGMKKSELKTTIQCLKNYEKYMKKNVESEKKSLQETINELGKWKQ